MFPMTTAYPRGAGGDTRGFSIIGRLKGRAERKRRGEAHESQILDSCTMLNYFTATVQVKAEEESITVYGAQVRPLCESSTWLSPLQWQLINTDPLLLICCLWPTTITNNSIIAMTIMAAIHSTQHQKRRRRRRWRRKRREEEGWLMASGL